jgi:hypothetical protein
VTAYACVYHACFALPGGNHRVTPPQASLTPWPGNLYRRITSCSATDEKHGVAFGQQLLPHTGSASAVPTMSTSTEPPIERICQRGAS